MCKNELLLVHLLNDCPNCTPDRPSDFANFRVCARAHVLQGMCVGGGGGG